MDNPGDEEFATAAPQPQPRGLPPPPRSELPPAPVNEAPALSPPASPPPQSARLAPETEEVKFQSTSPFLHLTTELLVSVSKPQLRNGQSHVSYEVNTYDHTQSGPELELLGVPSIYPIANPVKTTVYRRYQSFQVLSQILALFFPFCIIPPLPDSPNPNPTPATSSPSNPTSSVASVASVTDVYAQTSGLLHLFLSRLANHPLLSDSTILNFFLNHDNDEDLINIFVNQLGNKVQISTYRHFSAMLAQGKQQCQAGLTNLAQQSQSLPTIEIASNAAPTLFPLHIYTSIQQHLDQNIVPPNYPQARASVWNLCSTSLEASQGLRTSQGGNVISLNSNNNASIGASTNASQNNLETQLPSNSTGPTTIAATSTAFPSPSSLNSEANMQRAVTKISKASDAVALAAEVVVTPTQIMLGDVRSEEDGIRVENYLAALNDKLTALTQVLHEYDRQQSTLATSLGSLGGAVVTWSRYELFHHEDIRTILDSFAVALSRPHVETTPGPIRTQIIDYMNDLNRQTQSVRSCLLWRINLGTRLKSMVKTYQENQNQIQLLQSGKDASNMSVEHEIERLQQLNRSLLYDRQQQQKYLDLMHAYMIIEIAYWRLVRRQEIKKCIRSYALAMKQVCMERITMWSSVEHDIGQQLSNITQVRPFDRR